MGFLSGVLGAVKNENEVTTYDNYIEKPNKKLNEVLDTLTKNIGSGRAGLAASVAAVKEWLEGYENTLWSTTLNVETDLSTLLEDLSGKYIREINDTQDLQEQLKEWTRATGEIEKHVNETLQHNINDLDIALMHKLNAEIKPVQNVAAHLKSVADNVDLTRQLKAVEGELKWQKEHLQQKIREGSEHMKEVLRQQFHNIRECVQSLEHTKCVYLECIKTKVADANKFLEEQLGDINGATRDEIYTKFDEIKRTISVAYNNLNRTKNDLQNHINNAQTEFAKIKEGVGHQKSPSENKQDSIDYNWDWLKKCLAFHVERIYHKSATKGHLYHIEMKAKEYARELSKDGFIARAQQWVKDILDNKGMVFQYINLYVKENNGKYFQQQAENNITQEVIKHITNIVNKKIATVITGVNPVDKADAADIASNFSNVRNCFNSFAEELTTGSKSMEFKSSKIVQDIDAEYKTANILNKTQGKKHETSKLTSAVRNLISQLAAKATAAATEIVWLVKEYSASKQLAVKSSIAAEIDAAINQVKNISKDIDTGDTADSYGKRIDKALMKVKDRINDLAEHLEKIRSIDLKIQEIQENVLNTLHNMQKEKDKAGTDGDINEKRDAADGLMKELKSKLVYQLYLIESEIGVSNNALNVCITAVRKAFSQGNSAAIKAVTDFQKATHDTTEYAFNSITAQVRALFAESHRADLSALRSLVDQQLKAVQDIIAEDRVTGVKGMLKKMYGKDGENIKILEKVAPAASVPKLPTQDTTKKLSDACPDVELYFRSLFAYFAKETERLFKPLAKEENKYHKQLEEMYHKLKDFFDHIAKKNYDYKFVDLLSQLDLLVSAFPADTLPDAPKSVLAPLKAGLSNFAQQLGHAYVNRYSGGKFAGLLVETKQIEVEKDGIKSREPKEELTPEGRNCAKVCLTILGTIFEDLQTLNRFTVKQLAADYIYMYKVGEGGRNKSLNPLGDYFHQRGYKVPANQNTQDGELRQNKHWNGKYINHMLLNRKLENISSIEEHLKACDSNEVNQGTQQKKDNGFNIFDLLKCIYHHVDKYNEVCHLATFNATRSPCSVYEMLIWLSGLTHTGVHPAMVGKTFFELLKDPAKEAKEAQQEEEVDEPQISLVDPNSISLDAYPANIQYGKMHKTLTHICSKAYDVICKIVGTGDEYTTYGCDYSNNSFKLKYPSDPAACFDMLLDILRRLLPALRYIFQRCNVTAEHNGWRNCEYGKDVPTAKSHCSNKATSQATGQPTCEAKCQPTSPLMSYLNDCLPGHLPHNVSSIGCRSVCSNCPSASRLGMPCLTPMGFRGFSGSTKTGADLCEIIREFFGSGLVASLLGLSPTPPKTLPEHFGFVTYLVKGMIDTQVPTTNLITQRMESSITKQTIKLYEQPNKLTETLRDVYASRHTAVVDKPHLAAFADLSSLSIPTPCGAPDVQCAPYLSSLFCDGYSYLAHKHAATYLTWAVYLPWDFWTQLNNLCNAFKNIFCQDWGCHTCLRAEKCKRGQHGLVEKVENQPDKPHCKCPSMVQCKGVSATLYQFGFCFGNAATLNEKASPKSCSDFCSQLDRVLKSEYFKKLFTECDNFIWTIREPFTYMVLALWSLSLFYLICVMVGRLDVLHIRSHLRIPSSHRITAQSLLAAAQVGRLAKISYLQP
ncbi:hypothetical protein BBBOND_0111390 [Babesia bigemina]|uniref:C3H1-type domain-containing protein n=1 Tax=Babesia bigemina TaxID=5866 RepID=A0A061D268_BABBI|nr:hypothetical protein BBBOND_0111390 [Babesia bigemina]CDR94841.1 hypothetical protein BBBOND_0111390 [Babesia bigemina]|eukprot:XP_012767027.1 hypothetical protein BBBOND_0111390 [Babesia bigemina]